MTEKFEETIQKATQVLYDGRLKEAIDLLRPIYDGHPSLVGYDDLDRIGKDYAMMRDYMLQGYADPQRNQLYDRLLHDLYRVVANLMVSWRCKNVEVYATAFRTDNHLNRSHDFIKTTLERFLADGTMVEPASSETDEATKERYTRHQTFMERLFSALFISLQWTEADQTFFESLLLSPLIDPNDALLIISGVTLATMNVYDERKWLMLANIYTRASSEPIRQRALTGWALTSHPETAFFKSQQEAFVRLAADEQTRTELLELQKQVFFCMNAEKDNVTIHKEILPDMIMGSNLRMGRFGIEEKPNDELNDILHPNADEEAMERVEKSIDRMREMEKKGVDIYFGGFSVMKSFPFYRVLSNWFAPFSIHHPGIAQAQREIGNSKMIHGLLGRSPMCDSDKYSLVLALGEIIDRIPANLRDAMRAAGEFGDLPQADKEELASPTYIRRLYLQNLYRFFRLWPMRSQIEGCFTDQKSDKAFFFCSPLFDHQDFMVSKLQLGSFLLRRGMYDRLRFLLETMEGKEEGGKLDFLRGCLYLHDGQNQGALDIFSRLLANGRQSLSLLKATAKAAMATGDYLLAYNCLSKLQELEPNNFRTRLNTCLAALNAGKVKETLNTLYELYYNHPDDLTVQRVLAWTLLNGDNPQKALPIYEKLLAGKPVDEDYINAGYARWIAGDVAGAHETFGRYPNTQHIMDEFEKDRELLQRNGISHTDLTLMADAVKEGL